MLSKSRNILIIDNEPATCLAAKAMLMDIATVETLIEPEYAIRKIITFQPDLLLIDIDLKAVSGFEVHRQLIRELGQPNLPVIYTSSHLSYLSEEKALALGAVDYLRKPIHWTIARMRVMNQLRKLGQVTT